MRRKWALSLSVVGVLGLTLIVGRGLTGRATGGEEAESQGGCGGEPLAEETAERESALCPAGEVCTPTGPECNFDGYKNHYETDVDCGKTSQSGCPKCAAGKRCTANADCTTGSCSGYVCQKAAEGAYCSTAADCQSGLCAATTTLGGSPSGMCVRNCSTDTECTTPGFNNCQGRFRNRDDGQYMPPACSPFASVLDTDTGTVYAGLKEGQPSAAACTLGPGPSSRTADRSGPARARKSHGHDHDRQIGGGDPTSAPYDNCYLSYGATWCADYYTGKWCTNSSYWQGFEATKKYGTVAAQRHKHCF